MAGEIKHEWNGTILTITSDSGTSSADLKGDKGDKGCRGPQGRAGVIVNADGTVDMSGYATEAYVDEQIVKVNTGGAVDLSGYATKQYVDEKIAEGGGGSTDVDLSNYYTKSETNAAISTKIAEAQVDLEMNYAKKTDIPTVPTNVSAFTNDANYATKDYVDSNSGNVNLSNYYTKVQVDEKIISVALPDVSTVDNNKILMVVNGNWAPVSIETAEGGAY